MQYEQTHKIFLCFFREFLMHIRSGLCNVNLRIVRKKAIILKSNIVLSVRSFDLWRNALPHTCIKPAPAGLEMPELHGWRKFSLGTLGALAEADGTLPEGPIFLWAKHPAKFAHGTALTPQVPWCRVTASADALISSVSHREGSLTGPSVNLATIGAFRL